MAVSPGEGVGANLSRVADPPRVKFTSQSLPSPCRLCGGPTWLADELGSLHPCCELSRGQGAVVDAEGLLVCPACKASEVINREWRRRHG